MSSKPLFLQEYELKDCLLLHRHTKMLLLLLQLAELCSAYIHPTMTSELLSTRVHPDIMLLWTGATLQPKKYGQRNDPD